MRKIDQIAASEMTMKRQILSKEKLSLVAERRKPCQEITLTWNYGVSYL
jgi:hypothetical protein